METEWTAERIKEVNAEIAECIIHDVRETLTKAGCCHGPGSHADTPSMWLPEWIRCCLAAAYQRGKADAQSEIRSTLDLRQT